MSNGNKLDKTKRNLYCFKPQSDGRKGRDKRNWNEALGLVVLEEILIFPSAMSSQHLPGLSKSKIKTDHNNALLHPQHICDFA
jgi:hypothetical protein